MPDEGSDDSAGEDFLLPNLPYIAAFLTGSPLL